MIDIAEIAHTVDAYLRRHPQDEQRLVPLLASIDEKTAIADRSTFTGHVTCSVVLVDAEWRVLHIRHNALGAWLRPGGHVEPADASLHEVALRELHEETGISAGLVAPLGGALPIDIDIHVIPANPAKPEPEHPHFDMRHAFTLLDPAATLRLQHEEVNDHRWIAAGSIEPTALRDRLALLRPTP